MKKYVLMALTAVFACPAMAVMPKQAADSADEPQAKNASAQSIAREFLPKAKLLESRGFEKRLYCSSNSDSRTLIGLYFRNSRDLQPKAALVHQLSERFGSTDKPLLIRLTGSDPEVQYRMGYTSSWSSARTLAFKHDPTDLSFRFDLFRGKDLQGRVGIWTARNNRAVGSESSCFPRADQAIAWMLYRTPSTSIR